MTAKNPAIRVTDAGGGPRLELVRDLFRSYATEWSATIAETLNYQGFEAEVARSAGPLCAAGRLSAGSDWRKDRGRLRGHA